MAVITLTSREREILEALAGPCRLATPDQLARTFWPFSKSPGSDARRRLAALKDAGLIDTKIIMAHPEIELLEPVFSSPGDDPKDLGSVAYRVKKRWSQPLQATRVVIATPEAREMFGARPARATRRSETTHDLHLTAVYLHYRAHEPEAARRWVSGDELKIDGFEKVPDAVILGDEGRIDRVIDFVGSYSAGKLKAMHAEYARFPYELW